MEIFLRILFTLLICLLRSAWSTKQHHWNEPMSLSNYTCKAADCYEEARFINSIINNQMNPCDDFYEHVCGKWQEMHGNLVFYPEWSMDSEMGEKSFQKLRLILEEDITLHDNLDIKRAKNFFKQCNSLPYFGIAASSTVASHVRVTGYFPLFKSHDLNNSKKTWEEIHNFYFGITGESSLFDIALRNDKVGNFQPIFHISEMSSPYGLFIPTKQFSVMKLRSYAAFLIGLLKRVITRSSDWKSYSLVEKDVMDVLSFRRELYTLKLEHFMAEKRHQIMIVSQLHAWYHAVTKNYKRTARISWIEIFKIMYKNHYNLDKVKVTEVDVENRVYFRFLARILDKTPENVIVNHIHLYFIERHLSLNKHLKDLMLEVITENGKLLGSVRYLGRRWHLCIAANKVKEMLGLRYVSRYFSTKTKEAAERLARDLKHMLEIEVTDSTWLDKHTKKKCNKLIRDMRTTIGYPDFYDDRQRKSDYLESRIIEPGKIDAIYSPFSNRISVSAAYINPPLFSPRLPHAVTYGATGTRMAHEMYHAFGPDVIERREIENNWPQDMLEIYREKSRCFAEQFDGTPVQELKDIEPVPQINGNTTVIENIADTMGLQLAHSAFRKKLWLSQTCETLPNLPNTDCYKLFFISFAMSFCSAMTTDGMMEYVQSGKFSTPRMRVNGALSNLEAFSTAFNCPENSPMNPQKRCSLWD
ncbi:hypothetical protein KPH14_005483 [Odynerus spinipes]|uniref:Uncharacterized protein n=1 Tax=Odynerus spinipes TaxID=1348599 RepID=A0AAD9RBY4_9HYME|nr:hypothetical protein KPH14_005483 [Odynerus spinipes]